MRITVCLGGSVVAPDEPDVASLKEAARVLRELKLGGHEVLAVVGGGGLARGYVEISKKFGAPDAVLDAIGIDVTRLNARLLIAAIGELAEPSPAATPEAAARAMLKGKIPVMGGTAPGHTTDAVAAMLANVSKSELLVYFTDVDGVYSADPKVHPGAKKFERMSARELVRLVSGERFEPGIRTIMDPIAARLIERSGIKTLVLGRHELGRLPEIVEGAGHSGTTIEG